MSQFLIRLYEQLLHLYPRQFQQDYGEEMRSVFADAVADQPGNKSVILFLQELIDLPGSIMMIYTAKWSQGGKMSSDNEHIIPSTRRQAFIGMLPFLAFGIVSMISKIDQFRVQQTIFIYLAFYGLALLGLLIGWIRDFPLWSYGYIGWSLVFTWWWSMASINGVYWGLLIWFVIGIVILIALLWSRSLHPIETFFKDIFNDWSRLSLAMYTFIAFVYLIYDENHHPYLLIFMSASTLAITAGVWLFLRSTSLKGRIGAILAGLITSNVIGQVCDKTWDAAAYYNLPQGPPTPWYMIVYRTAIILSFLIIILFWPAIIGLGHRLIDHKAGNP